jgi:hypothetical protein
MGLSAELAGDVHKLRGGLPNSVREAGISAIVRICAARTARSGGGLGDALLSPGEMASATTRPVPDTDALSSAAAIAAAAHLVLGCDAEPAVPCACPVAAAAIATAARTDVSGVELLEGVALGIEVQLRIASAMSPDHEDAGWYPTGTVGPIGAAVAAGLVAGSSPERLTHGIGIATSMSLGHGVLTGPVAALHAGKAASNGVLAAHLAQQDFTSSATAIEGPRGYFTLLAPSPDKSRVLAGLGERWLILEQAGPRPVEVPATLATIIATLEAAPSVRPLLVAMKGLAA